MDKQFLNFRSISLGSYENCPGNIDNAMSIDIFKALMHYIVFVLYVNILKLAKLDITQKDLGVDIFRTSYIYISSAPLH